VPKNAPLALSLKAKASSSSMQTHAFPAALAQVLAPLVPPRRPNPFRHESPAVLPGFFVF